jgi:hypothetical protein
MTDFARPVAMSDENFALSTMLPPSATEGDYDAICATVMESTRGRWFLQEYAKRNRHADTTQVLGAIERIESVIRGERGRDAYQSFRAELVDMAKAIATTQAEVADLKPDAAPAADAEASEPDGTIERLRDIAWTMRERGLDPATCEQIEGLAIAISSASSLRDPGDPRVERLREALGYLERRINGMLAAVAETAQDTAQDTAEAATAPTAPPRATEAAPAMETAVVAGMAEHFGEIVREKSAGDEVRADAVRATETGGEGGLAAEAAGEDLRTAEASGSGEAVPDSWRIVLRGIAPDEPAMASEPAISAVPIHDNGVQSTATEQAVTATPAEETSEMLLRSETAVAVEEFSAPLAVAVGEFSAPPAVAVEELSAQISEPQPTAGIEEPALAQPAPQPVEEASLSVPELSAGVMLEEEMPDHVQATEAGHPTEREAEYGDLDVAPLVVVPIELTAEETLAPPRPLEHAPIALEPLFETPMDVMPAAVEIESAAGDEAATQASSAAAVPPGQPPDIVALDVPPLLATPMSAASMVESETARAPEPAPPAAELGEPAVAVAEAPWAATEFATPPDGLVVERVTGIREAAPVGVHAAACGSQDLPETAPVQTDVSVGPISTESHGALAAALGPAIEAVGTANVPGENAPAPVEVAPSPELVLVTADETAAVSEPAGAPMPDVPHPPHDEVPEQAREAAMTAPVAPATAEATVEHTVTTAGHQDVAGEGEADRELMRVDDWARLAQEFQAAESEAGAQVPTSAEVPPAAAPSPQPETVTAASTTIEPAPAAADDDAPATLAASSDESAAPHPFFPRAPLALPPEEEKPPREADMLTSAWETAVTRPVEEVIAAAPPAAPEPPPTETEATVEPADFLLEPLMSPDATAAAQTEAPPQSPLAPVHAAADELTDIEAELFAPAAEIVQETGSVTTATLAPPASAPPPAETTLAVAQTFVTATRMPPSALLPEVLATSPQPARSAAAPARSAAKPMPRPAPNDPLAALRAMTDEERIALFT